MSAITRRFPVYGISMLVLASGMAQQANAFPRPHEQPRFVAAAGADALAATGPIPVQSTTIADIAQSVAPAVVNIEVKHPVKMPTMGAFPFNIPFGFGGEGGMEFFSMGEELRQIMESPLLQQRRMDGEMLRALPMDSLKLPIIAAKSPKLRRKYHSASARASVLVSSLETTATSSQTRTW